MSRSTVVGYTVTVIWIFLCAVFIATRWDRALEMQPNEWGELAAGAIAPLAFLWLILGYHQNREELKQNTEVLKLQQRELEFQVKETANLVGASTRQAQASEAMLEASEQRHRREVQDRRKEASLVLRFVPVGVRQGRLAVNLVSTSGIARDMEVVAPPEAEARIRPNVLYPGGKATLSFILTDKTTDSLTLHLAYTDIYGDRRATNIRHERGVGFSQIGAEDI